MAILKLCFNLLAQPSKMIAILIDLSHKDNSRYRGIKITISDRFDHQMNTSKTLITWGPITYFWYVKTSNQWANAENNDLIMCFVRTKKFPHSFPWRNFLNLAVLIFPGRLQPSIFSVSDFTSVFGMGTGVSPILSPPENFQTQHQTVTACYTLLTWSWRSFSIYKFHGLVMQVIF